MLLSVLERIQILSLLPKEGNVFLLRMIQETIKTVGFTEKELKLLNIVTEGSITKWKPIAPAYVDVVLGTRVRELVIEKLQEMEKETTQGKKLSLEMLPLYERFIENKETEALKEFRKSRGKQGKIISMAKVAGADDAAR